MTTPLIRRRIRLELALALAVVMAALPTALHAQNRTLEIDDLRLVVSLSTPVLSPDGTRAVLIKSVPNYDDNRTDRKMLLIDIATGAQRELTPHRGGVVTDDIPECSLAAIRAASQFGYDLVELDIQESADGEPIVFHDDSLDEACGVAGTVSSMTAKELESITFSVNGEPIHHLQDALALCAAENLGVMLDVEPDGGEAFYERIIALLDHYQLTKATMCIGNPAFMRHHFGDRIMLRVSDKELAPRQADDIPDLTGKFWFGLPRILPSETVAKYQQRGLLVIPALNTFRYDELTHGADPEADAIRLREATVDGFQIDSVYQDFFRSNVPKVTGKPQKYSDGRPEATLRMDAKDHGIVLRYGDGPDKCDMLGARDVWVFEDSGTYYMHYDAAGPKGWLSSLAVSKDLLAWEKKGPILDFGKPGEDDSAGACYGVTYKDGNQWHMFYLGTPNTSKAPDLVPSFPYLTMKAKASGPAGPWTKQKNVVPFRTKPNTYYSLTASPGHVIKNAGEYLQFFSATTRKPGNPSVQRTLGIARTKDLDGVWTVDPSPMVPIEEQIENSTLYYEKSNKTWFLFTNHIGIDKGEYTDAIWVYWSKDLNKWDPASKAVVLDGENCSWSSKCIGLPSVIKVGKRLVVFYDAPGGNSTSHMKRNIALAWLELPLSVPRDVQKADQ